MAFSKLLIALVAAALGAQAIPLQVRQSTLTTLTSSAITAYRPYSYYASTGYCQPAATLAWNCGANCNANPTFKPIASGGDGSSVQFWFVGYDSTLKTIIVSHQGTNPSQIEALVTDGKFILTNLDSTLFPGISNSIEVHDGFAEEQAQTATKVLAAVKTGLSTYGASKVTVVGHSLGAAIALLDGVYLTPNLPGVSVSVIGYGMPRVGNPAFANYVDAHVPVTRVTNKHDPVPIIPGQFLGFQHPSGEKHIEDSNSWVACSGQDNPSTQCSVGEVPTILSGVVADHDGPYDVVTMGC